MSGDKAQIAALRELYLRMHRRPPPICSACDYEFEFGEWPPLAYLTRPAFPKANHYASIVGAICSQCALLPTRRLTQAISRSPGFDPGMWPGDTADVTTLIPVIDRLRRRFDIARVLCGRRPRHDQRRCGGESAIGGAPQERDDPMTRFQGRWDSVHRPVIGLGA